MSCVTIAPSLRGAVRQLCVRGIQRRSKLICAVLHGDGSCQMHPSLQTRLGKDPLVGNNVVKRASREYGSVGKMMPPTTDVQDPSKDDCDDVFNLDQVDMTSIDIEDFEKELMAELTEEEIGTLPEHEDFGDIDDNDFIDWDDEIWEGMDIPHNQERDGEPEAVNFEGSVWSSDAKHEMVDPDQFSDSLLPWDIDSTREGDMQRQIFETKKKVIPDMNSIDDLLSCSDVEVHMAQDQAGEELEMHEKWPLHEVINCLLREQTDEIVVVQVDKPFHDYAKFVVVASARSVRHLRSTGQQLLLDLRSKGIQLAKGRLAGRNDEHWILLDVAPYMIHIMRPEARAYYKLENLWAPRGSPLYEEVGDNDIL